ncbi:MAG: DHHW family protein [Anaerovoracaceae bacterium]
MKYNATKKDIILLIGFFTILIAYLLSALISPDKTFSENENRYLSQAPEVSGKTIFEGSFMDDFETYTADQFPLRNGWVAIRNTCDMTLGKKDNGHVYFGRDNWLFALEKINEDQRKSNLCYLIEFLAETKKKYPHVASFVLPAPSASEIIKAPLPAYAPVPHQLPRINELKANLKGLATVCDVSGHLVAAQAFGEDLYYRTDHHWTTLGAYYAYRHFAIQADFPPHDLDDYIVTPVTDSFYGTNDSKANLPWTKPDSIMRFSLKEHDAAQNHKIYDESFLNTKDKYSYFLGGNDSLILIDTEIQNGKTLLLIKDSFANCFVPFLTDHYERIILIDLRYYKEGVHELFKENNITDLLILYSFVQLCNDQNLFYLKY